MLVTEGDGITDGRMDSGEVNWGQQAAGRREDPDRAPRSAKKS